MRAQMRQILRQNYPPGSKSNRGTIVNVCAVQGLAAQPGMPSYSAASWGVIGMSKTVALDHIDSGIRINCVCHGVLSSHEKTPVSSTKDLQPLSPNFRATRPEEVAAAVSFLAGDNSLGINGISLPVDGGWCLAHY